MPLLVALRFRSAERSGLGELAIAHLDIAPLIFEIVGDRAGKTRVGEEMR